MAKKKRKRAPGKVRAPAARSIKRKKRAPERAAPKSRAWYTQGLAKEATEKFLNQNNYKQVLPEDRERVARAIRIEQRRVIAYLQRAVKGYTNAAGKYIPGLRDIYQGFDPSAGYDLRRPDLWDARRMRRVFDLGPKIHTLTSRSYAVLKITGKGKMAAKQRRAARSLTGQLDRKQKAYIVGVDNDKQTAEFTPDGRVNIRSKDYSLTYWLFKDFNGGKFAHTYKEMVAATKRMLPLMPDHYFSFYSRPHGIIGSPVPKSSLLLKLKDYFESYDDPGYWLLGWADQGNEVAAVQRYAKRLTKTAKNKRWKKKETEQFRRAAAMFGPRKKAVKKKKRVAASRRSRKKK